MSITSTSGSSFMDRAKRAVGQAADRVKKNLDHRQALDRDYAVLKQDVARTTNDSKLTVTERTQLVSSLITAFTALQKDLHPELSDRIERLGQELRSSSLRKSSLGVEAETPFDVGMSDLKKGINDIVKMELSLEERLHLAYGLIDASLAHLTDLNPDVNPAGLEQAMKEYARSLAGSSPVEKEFKELTNQAERFFREQSPLDAKESSARLVVEWKTKNPHVNCTEEEKRFNKLINTLAIEAQVKRVEGVFAAFIKTQSPAIEKATAEMRALQAQFNQALIGDASPARLAVRFLAGLEGALPNVRSFAPTLMRPEQDVLDTEVKALHQLLGQEYVTGSMSVPEAFVSLRAEGEKIKSLLEQAAATFTDVLSFSDARAAAEECEGLQKSLIDQLNEIERVMGQDLSKLTGPSYENTLGLFKGTVEGLQENMRLLLSRLQVLQTQYKEFDFTVLTSAFQNVERKALDFIQTHSAVVSAYKSVRTAFEDGSFESLTKENFKGFTDDLYSSLQSAIRTKMRELEQSPEALKAYRRKLVIWTNKEGKNVNFIQMELTFKDKFHLFIDWIQRLVKEWKESRAARKTARINPAEVRVAGLATDYYASVAAG